MENNPQCYMHFWCRFCNIRHSQNPCFGKIGVSQHLCDSTSTLPGNVRISGKPVVLSSPFQIKGGLPLVAHPSSHDWSHQTQVRTKIQNVNTHSSCRIFKGQDVVADSGNVMDNTLKGGRLGVFCFSQEQVIWSDLSYNCREKLPQEVYGELSPEEQNEVAPYCPSVVNL